MLLITPTSGRPKAFAKLLEYVQRQTFDNWEWLVVTDDWEDYKFPKKLKVIKRENQDDTLPSLCHNILEALNHVGDNQKLCFLDDDDWYHSNYLHEVNRHLDKTELFGFNEDAYYYVLSRRPKRMHNQDHAALASTACRASVIPCLKNCASQGNVFIDRLLWKTWTGKRLLAHNFTGIPYQSRQEPKLDGKGNIENEWPRHVGMKQNWHGGKEGLSDIGHTPEGGEDLLGLTLKKWLGEDAQYYLNFTKPPELGTANIIMPYPPELAEA